MNITHDQLKKIISDLTGISISDIKEDAEFIKDLRMDSLKFVELLAILSEEHQIMIPEDMAAKLHTYRSLFDFVNH